MTDKFEELKDMDKMLQERIAELESKSAQQDREIESYMDRYGMTPEQKKLVRERVDYFCAHSSEMSATEKQEALEQMFRVD